MDYGRCRIITSWECWDCAIHESDAQIERQSKSVNYPFTFKINKKKKTGKFSSTFGPSDYDTDLEKCTCGDFKERKLPCKHMYRLASELGIIEIIRRTPGGQNKELLNEVKACENVDEHPEQIKRIEKAKEAKCKPISIDYENRCAMFEGSAKVPYETTEQTCTCRDYFVRRLPCKHIYRLRIELGK